MNAQFWIQLIVAAGSLIVFLTTLAFYVGKARGEFATKMELKEKVRERDEKIQSVYARIDEHKRDCTDTYVRKDLCGQMHTQNKEEIRRIEDDNKTSRHELLNIIQKINLTLELYNDKFAELKELILKK